MIFEIMSYNETRGLYCILKCGSYKMWGNLIINEAVDIILCMLEVGV